jgi:probable phosphoglycerate mutase
MTTVLLVRHGETAWNAERRLQGWAPVPLSERGRGQARTLAEGLVTRFDIDAVTASDLRRARQTAELLADPLGVDVTVDDGWRERDFGVLQGLSYDAFDERHPEYSLSQVGEAAIDARPDGGESLAELRDRALDAWDRVVATAGPDETHLVVTHGGPIYLVLGHLLDRSVIESVLESSQANCAVNEVRVDGSDVEVVRENDTGLLAEGSDGG